MYKTINNISDLQFEDYFYLTTSNYFLRSHSLQIKTKENFNCPKLTHSFFGRTPSLWNALPEKLVESPSLNVFKFKLKTHLLKLSYYFLSNFSPLSISLYLPCVFTTASDLIFITFLYISFSYFSLI